MMCDCGQPDIVYQPDTAEEVCVNCGVVVVQNVLCEDRDWSFDEYDDQSRVGAPGASLGTCLFDVPGVSRKTMACAADREDVVKRGIKASIEATCAALRIYTPSVISTTAEAMFEVYSKACPGLHGESRTAGFAACVYYACRSRRADRDLRSVSLACRVDMKALNAAAAAVNDALRGTPYAPLIAESSPGEMIGRCVSALDLPPADRKRLFGEAHRVFEETYTDSGKKPRTVLSDVLKTASVRLGLPLTKKHIATAVK